MARMVIANTITALTTAGMTVMRLRQWTDDPAAHELATALRDDIKTMVGDVEALQAVVAGR